MSWRQSSNGPVSQGYYHGTPYYGGSGSGYGVKMAGTGSYAQGQGPLPGTSGSWSPTIMYLFVLVIAEMVVFSILSKHV